jgi:hypothetical protein
VVSDADLARYDAMAEALIAPDLAYHLLLAGLCRRTESQDFCITSRPLIKLGFFDADF